LNHRIVLEQMVRGKVVPASRIEPRLSGHLANSLVTLPTELQTVVTVQNNDPGKNAGNCGRSG